MTNEKAIETLSRELRHTESHMKIEGKESEYYEELSQIAEALRIAIEELKKEESIWWEVIEHGKTGLDTIVKCPKCNTIRQGMTHYCSWCGSKMMWNGMPLDTDFDNDVHHEESGEDNEQ